MTLDALTRAGLALLAVTCALQAGADDFRYNQCNMDNGNNRSTMTFVLPLGDYYVPRDVPVGTPIGKAFDLKAATNPEGLRVYCNREGAGSPGLPNPVFVSDVVALGKPYAGSLPAIGGHDLTGKVFHTSVPGVGIAMQLTNPYLEGGNSGNFETPTRLAPFRGTNFYEDPTLAGPALNNMGVFALLIKIGDIAPGQHAIVPDVLFEGSMMPAVPKAFTIAAAGTIRQAQCSLHPTDPVSAVPVQLGSWRNEDFSGPGSTTTAVPFTINLVDCESNAGSDNLGFATAHIKLEGTDGSTIIDKDLGLVGLDSAATAQGVGIQVLMSDATTPVILGESVPITRLQQGNTQMHLNARLYQLPGSTAIKGGTTTGALNFTVNYL